MIETRSETIVVRAPLGAEERLARMVLPESLDLGGPPQFLVAAGPGTGQRMMGALAWRALPTVEGPAAWFVLRTIKDQRRKGAGSALLRAFLESAAHEGAATAQANVGPAALEEGTALPFLAAHGFQRTDRTFVFEMAVDAIVDMLSPLRARLLARGKVPADARTVSLGEAPFDQVGALYQRFFVERAEDVEDFYHARDRQGGFFSPSRAALVGEKLVGLVFVREARDRSTGARKVVVDRRIVAPEHQGLWPVVFLMLESALAAKADGVERFQFESPEANAQTMKIARRGNAQLLGTRETYAIGLAAARVPSRAALIDS